MTAPRPVEDTARLGVALYERDIRSQVEAEHHGEYVAIDVDSGCWAISDDLRPPRSNCARSAPKLSMCGF